MRPLACPLCGARQAAIEAMAQPDRWFCNGCGFLFVLDEAGIVVHAEPTTKSRTAPRSAFRDAVSRNLAPPLNPMRAILRDYFIPEVKNALSKSGHSGGEK